MSRVSPNKFVWGENKNWAIVNKQQGIYSLASGLVGTAIGCVKACTNEDSFINKFSEFSQAVAYGARNNFQYSIYSRKEDDDLGEDMHERPHAANIGEIACLVEKKVNPILLPLSSLLGKNISESYSSMAHFFNALWWRIRLCSKQINWKGFNKTFLQNIKNLFNKDVIYRSVATEDIEKVLTPAMGFIGAGSIGLFTPIKSFMKLTGTNNKVINFLSNIGYTTQHLAYLLRFTLPELWEAQFSNSQDSKILASIGVAANSTNICLPVVDLLPFDDGFLGTVKKLYKELATGFTAAFFSTRRHLMGKEWLEENQ